MPEAPSEETTLRAMVNDREARIQAMIRARVNPIMAQLRQALPVDTAAGIVLLIPNGDLHLPEETKPVPGEDLLMVLTSHRTRVRKAVRAWLGASQEEEPAPASTFRPQSVTELPAPDAIAIGRAIRKTLQEEPGGPQDVDSLIRGVLATLAQGYAL